MIYDNEASLTIVARGIPTPVLSFTKKPTVKRLVINICRTTVNRFRCYSTVYNLVDILHSNTALHYCKYKTFVESDDFYLAVKLLFQICMIDFRELG